MIALRIAAVIGLLIASLAVPVPSASVAQDTGADAELVEHASDVFLGRIDILTAITGSASEYTVLVAEVLKGGLTPQSIVVARVDGLEPLAPGAEYLFLTRYEPGQLRYVALDVYAIEGGANQRNALIQHWTGLVEETSCAYTDVLVLDGAVFARRDWNDDKRYLEREWVGPSFATVAVQDTSATGCRDDLADGTASEIPVGTKIHELDGYARSFRVAVRLPDRHRYLYEVIWSSGARFGADLLDLRDRVKQIAWTDTVNCREMGVCTAAAVAIIDPQVIRTVVSLVLNANVGRPRFESTANFEEHFTLTFELDDGSTLTLSIDAEAGVTRSGIRVPVEEIRNAFWGDL